MSSPGSSSEYFRKIPYKQDVAPPGGYKKIPIGPNLPVKIPLSGVRLALAVGGITALGWARFWYGAKQYRKLREEKNIARLSLIPFLLAEQDRAMLKKEQEIRTSLINKRENPESNPKCRFCKVMDESIFHILNSCTHLSVSMYLPVRHNEVGKVIYNELLNKTDNTHDTKNPESTYKNDKIELWWDKKIAVQPPVEHNRPDIVLWELENNKCFIIDICVPMDVNVKREEKEKCDKYLILASRLQRLYPRFTYEVVPIVVGSTGYVPKTLKEQLEKCGFDSGKIRKMIPILQRKALRGSVKIVKTAMKLR